MKRRAAPPDVNEAIRDVDASIAEALRHGKVDALSSLEQTRGTLAKIGERYRRDRATRVVIGFASFLLIAGAVTYFIPLPEYRIDLQATVQAARVKSGQASQAIISNWSVRSMRAPGVQGPQSAFIRTLELYRDASIDISITGDDCTAIRLQDGHAQAVWSIAGGDETSQDLGPGSEVTICDGHTRRMLLSDVSLVVLGAPVGTANRDFRPSIVSAKIAYPELGKDYVVSPASVMRVSAPAQSELLIDVGKEMKLSLLAWNPAGSYSGPAPRNRFEPTVFEWVVSSPQLKALIAGISGVIGALWSIRQKLS